MAESVKTKVDLEALGKLGGTKEVLEATEQLREQKRLETEKLNAEYKYPETTTRKWA